MNYHSFSQQEEYRCTHLRSMASRTFLDCLASSLKSSFLLVAKGDSLFCKESTIEMNYLYDHAAFFVAFLPSI